MKKNVGSIDKAVRLTLAALVAALFLVHVITGILAIILLVIAVILVLTVFISFCPIYFPFGISSRKKE
jgi:hypothetical protein